MKQTRLKELEESFESKLISKEEYEKKKKEIEEISEENIEEFKESEDEMKEPKLKSDKVLIIGVVLIIMLFIAVFGVRYFTQEKPETIDDLHALNLKGKLKPEQGYLYKGAYSFVKFDDLWYVQLVSPKGTRFYNVQFRYGPREVEDIKIYGKLNTELFNDATDYYVTFNPNGNYNPNNNGSFSHVVLAVGDFNEQMIKIFFKQPIAACDKNETSACIGRPIITCDNTDKVVLYIKEADNVGVYYDDNCIVVEGSGFDLVRGIDRVLLDLYEFMEQ